MGTKYNILVEPVELRSVTVSDKTPNMDPMVIMSMSLEPADPHIKHLTSNMGISVEQGARLLLDLLTLSRTNEAFRQAVKNERQFRNNFQFIE